MSKLDEIYFDIHYSNPPHDKLFMININNDLVYQKFKEELKDFLTDLVNEVTISDKGPGDVKEAILDKLNEL